MKRLSLPLTVALPLAALAVAGALNLRLAAQLLSRPFDVAYLPSGAAARVGALGHRTFLSDLYWLQTVQYVGDPKADQRGYDKLLPLVDLVTDLDPRHGYAYQTAGIVLSAVGRLDESDRILLKGIEKGPPYWTFPYYLAFNAWFYRGDYEKGAHYARLAAKVPGAAPSISHLAVSLSSKSGTPEDALRVLADLRATVKDEVTAAALEDQVRLATLERDAQALERASSRFRELHGRGSVLAPTSSSSPGSSRRIPKDPFGGEYVWDPADPEGPLLRERVPLLAAGGAAGGRASSSRARPSSGGSPSEERHRARLGHRPGGAPPEARGEPARVRRGARLGLVHDLDAHLRRAVPRDRERRPHRHRGVRDAHRGVPRRRARRRRRAAADRLPHRREAGVARAVRGGALRRARRHDDAQPRGDGGLLRGGARLLPRRPRLPRDDPVLLGDRRRSRCSSR